MTPAKKRKTLPLKPYHVNAACWFYISKTGLLLVQQAYSASGAYLGTAQTTVPWDKLLKALNIFREVTKEKRRIRGTK